MCRSHASRRPCPLQGAWPPIGRALLKVRNVCRLGFGICLPGWAGKRNKQKRLLIPQASKLLEAFHHQHLPKPLTSLVCAPVKSKGKIRAKEREQERVETSASSLNRLEVALDSEQHDPTLSTTMSQRAWPASPPRGATWRLLTPHLFFHFPLPLHFEY
uniref:Uncharacterized protein n=1 Tax=Physcomitrium patens TaxID=3218 RepID=A0A7I4EF89_PHYPA